MKNKCLLNSSLIKKITVNMGLDILPLVIKEFKTPVTPHIIVTQKKILKQNLPTTINILV